MHLVTRIILVAFLCLTVVPGRMSLVVRAHRHHHHHPHRSSPAKTLGLPVCAKAALKTEAEALGCKPHHSARCLCKNPNLFPRLMTAITQSCTAAEQATVRTEVESFCGADLVVSITTSAASPPKPPVTQTQKTTVIVTTSKTATLATQTLRATNAPPKTTKQTLTETKTSPMMTSATKMTKATKSTSSANGAKPTESSKGTLFLGGSGRVEASLGAFVLALVVAAMGWIFDEL